MLTFKFTLRFTSAFLLEVVTSIPSNFVCYLLDLNFQLCVGVATVSHLGWGYGSKYIIDLRFTSKFTLTFTSAFLLEVISWVPLYALGWMHIRLVIMRRLQIRAPRGWQHSFMQIDHEIFSKVILFKKGICQFLVKECAQYCLTA